MTEVEKIAHEQNCDRIELNCWMFNTDVLNMHGHIGFDRQRIIYEKKLSR